MPGTAAAKPPSAPCTSTRSSACRWTTAVDRAGHLQPRHERRLGHPGNVAIDALSEVQIDQPDRCVRDVDRNLAGPGDRIG